MVQDTIATIESKLRDNASLKPETKQELLGLLGNLKGEISRLAQTKPDEAETVAGFAEISTREATRQEKKPELLELSVQGLATSVEEFETTHPRLVELVNRICTTLSNMGI